MASVVLIKGPQDDARAGREPAGARTVDQVRGAFGVHSVPGALATKQPRLKTAQTDGSFANRAV